MSMASVILIVIVAGVCAAFGVHFFRKSKNRIGKGANEIIEEMKPEEEGGNGNPINSHVPDELQPNTSTPATKTQDEPQSADKNVLIKTNHFSDNENKNSKEKEKSISPKDRGGRPRVEQPERTNEEIHKESYYRKPELVCMQKDMKWYLGVEKTGNESDYEVKQNGKALTETVGLFLIEDILGSLVIKNKSTGSEQSINLADEQNHLLIFKLSGESIESGRLVRYATKGNYLVIVPRNWSRNEEKSGIAFLQPCDCSLDEYQAHFFHLDSESDSRIAFWNSDGEEIENLKGNLQFDLNGNELCDANEEMGPLFGNGELTLVSNQPATIEKIKTIVIGEEGNDIPNRWKKEFKSIIVARQINVAEQLNGRTAAWYFLRMYDSEDKLIDSLDFRFVPNLEKIVVAEHSIFPNENCGHLSVKVVFECCDAGACDLELVEPNTALKITKLNEKQIEIIIPSRPIFDMTKWKYKSKTNSQVHLSLLVERVWWNVSSDEDRTWKDLPIGLSRDDFRATSESKLSIKLPRKRWTDKVRVGFNVSKAREYPVKVDDEVVEIPLNHFGDDGMLNNEGELYFKLFLEYLQEQTVAFIKKIEYRCKVCNEVLSPEGIRSHFVGSHQYKDHVKEVDKWNEYIGYFHLDPNLPFRVYMCENCDKHIMEFERGDYSQDKIVKHIEDHHPGESIKFREIRDIETIRKLLPHIKPLYRCNLCRTYFESLNDNEIWKHLLSDHNCQFIERTG